MATDPANPLEPGPREGADLSHSKGEHKPGVQEMSKSRTARVAIITGAIAGILATVGPVAIAAAGDLAHPATTDTPAAVTVVVTTDAPLLAIG